MNSMSIAAARSRREPAWDRCSRIHPGKAAGRLIDQCGLKGTRVGDAEISTVHANFFVNHGQASASDVKALIDLARQRVNEEVRN